ncbi:MAG: hypothetical protein M3P93_12850 [Actinomycetota bacterium]|nr:hypothetical protein [Actinomycetota bacterium]
MSLSPPPRRVVPAGRPTLVLLVLLLAACTGSGSARPDVEDFASGTCRDAAPAVLALEERVRRATERDADESAVRESLREQQARLRALRGGGGEAASALEDVVARVGFARVALDVDALDREEVTDVTAAVDRFVAVCVPARR